MPRTRSLAVLVPAALIMALALSAAALMLWAGNRLIEACAVGVLSAGFVLGGWHFADWRHWRDRRATDAAVAEATQTVERSRAGLALLFIAWGALLPLLDLWWEARTTKTLVAAGGAVALGVAIEYLWLRRLAPHLGRGQHRNAKQLAPRSPGWWRRWRGWLIAAVLVALVGSSFTFSAWVGFHVRDPEGHFNWELFGIVGTALGTSLLASVTGVLALVTSADVEASSNIARITREEQEARSRPIVLVERVDLSVGSKGDSDVDIVLRNAGLGVAVRGVIEIRYVEGVTMLVKEIVRATSLTSGETKTVKARVVPSQPLQRNYRRPDWSLSGWFVDAADQRHKLLDGQSVEPNERPTIVDPPEDLRL